ncbi:hypothetical protein CVT24_003488 [Panaeolus cyanescens]|uniref:Uncharacterized protein n=1 Tax=Panaeolus cyanescens TaxID=181874 RepID=A0A409Y7I3_9AGAR|nr:hypothetical protein CVT24_003488 [Panaeolus cyanescens]
MSSNTASREPYLGEKHRLIIAIDVGTAYSGVSYRSSLLEPGQIPEIHGVNRYPGQDRYGGDSKIPTIMWYDSAGTVRAAGAEALLDQATVAAEEEGWIRAEWFKIYMKPNAIAAPPETYQIPELPLGKDVVEVFGDFLRYIYACAQSYIIQSHPGGSSLWDILGDDIEFILTHPNGYEGVQQEMMRKAAILGGLVGTPEDAQEKIKFVTEGEASLHYCIQCGLDIGAMKQEGHGVMVVDAGGGTIDISTYQQKDDAFEEIAAAECAYNGGIFVTLRAQEYFQRILEGSKYADSVPDLTKAFDQFTKPIFAKQDDDYYVRFGNARDNDPTVNIKAGRMKITGFEIAEFFDPSLNAIMDVFNDLRKRSPKAIKTVFFVGGFSSNDFFFSEMSRYIAEDVALDGNEEISVCRPDRHLNKAVAHGGVSYYLDHRVTTRVSKLTFGVRCNVPLNSQDDEHIKRESTKYRSQDGIWRLPNAFETILPRNTQVSETKEFRRPFITVGKDVASLQQVKSTIRCYRGQHDNPMWVSDEPDKFSIMCTIEANLEELTKSLSPIRYVDENGHEHVHYRANYEVALLFGLTEFKAVVIWQEDVSRFVA